MKHMGCWKINLNRTILLQRKSLDVILRSALVTVIIFLLETMPSGVFIVFHFSITDYKYISSQGKLLWSEEKARISKVQPQLLKVKLTDGHSFGSQIVTYFKEH